MRRFTIELMNTKMVDRNKITKKVKIIICIRTKNLTQTRDMLKASELMVEKKTIMERSRLRNLEAHRKYIKLLRQDLRLINGSKGNEKKFKKI